MLLPNGDDVVCCNRWLAALLPEDRAALLACSRVEHAARGQVLSGRGHPSAGVWFPHGGVIALTLAEDGRRSVQAGLVGAEGCAGLERVFPHMPAMAEAVVQIPGAMTVVPAAALRAAAEARPHVQAVFARFLFALSAECLRTVACNRLHSLDARCCRWLLMLHDRTGEADLPLTQEALATMLGSGRPRINALLARMEQDGLLRRLRACIRLHSRRGLERRSCECYRLVQGAGQGT